MKNAVIALLLFFLIPLTLEARTWEPIGPEAASITQILADRGNASLFYAVTNRKGQPGSLYRSTDSGQSWRRCPLNNVNRAAINPTTGELYAFSYQASTGEERLWYSANHGFHFALKTSHGGTPSNIFFDPSNPERLYGSGLSRWGLSFSNDGGVNWKDFTNFPLKLGGRLPSRLSGQRIWGYEFSDVFIPPTSPKIIFASGGITGKSCCDPAIVRFLLRSEDSGKTWRFLEKELDVEGYGAYKFHFDPLYPDRAFAFNGQQLKRLKGDTWTSISQIFLTDLISVPGSRNQLLGLAFNRTGGKEILFSTDEGQTWHRTDPSFNDNLQALQSFKDGLLAGMNGGGIYRNANGHDWLEANTGFNEPFVTQVTQNRAGTVVYSLLNDHFLYRSVHSGKDWTSLTVNFPFASYDTYITLLTMNPSDPKNLIADHTAVAVTKDGGKTWTRIGNSFDYPAFDPNLPDVVYFSSHKRIWKSTEKGTNPAPLPLQFSKSYIRTFVDPYDSRTLYFVAGSVYKSTDGGRRMRQIATEITRAVSIDALPNPNNFILLTADGFVYLTKDGGENWTPVSQAPASKYGGNQIAAASSNHFFILASGRLLESLDSGVTWTDITREFGSDFKARRAFVWDIGDPKSPRFYVATTRGVFVQE